MRRRTAHDVRQLFHHLRHRVVEKRHQRDCVDDLLHGAPQIPLLRSGQPVRPGAPELRHTVIVVEREVLCCQALGGGVLPELGRVLRLVLLPRPCPYSDLVRYGACTRTGPWRRSSVHTSGMHGGVALFAASRLPQRVRHRIATT